MRIALVSTQRTAVPPKCASSIELVVGLIADELLNRGHDVTLFAAGDSKTRARLVATIDKGYTHDPTVWEWQTAEIMQMGTVYARASEFDIIHSHVYCYAIPFASLVRTPTIHTFHHAPTPDVLRFCAMNPDQFYVAISYFQSQMFNNVPIAGIVHNGIDSRSFPFSTRSGRYLVYLGNFSAAKGPLEAVRCARKAGIPIRLAGPYSEYFENVIKPELDGQSVDYVGELDHQGKIDLLVNALALVFPSRDLEAFGLVMIEAMACGTPVLALAQGPGPEIVGHGVGGLIVGDPNELSRAINKIHRLDRARVRRRAVEHFDVSRMVDGYLEIYQRALRK